MVPEEIDLESLYDEYAGAVYGFALTLSRHPEEAADLLQDVFVKLVRDPGIFCRARDSRSFLFKMTHNLFIDLVRKNQSCDRRNLKWVKESFDLFKTSSDPDKSQFRQRLNTALGELPEPQRAVIHLKVWEDMTFDSIASTLGINANTAAARYRYGIDKLRTLLRPLDMEI